MPKTRDVGVVVGRFQVHKLHDAHLQILNQVYQSHAQTVVVLGLSQARVSTSNPLDFEARKQMLLESFPKATIFYIKDERDDAVWSKKLDQIIGDYVSPSQSVCLYGGRDSFIAHYTGHYPTEVLEPTLFVSGTEMRKSIAKAVKGTEDFRAGVIWAANNGYSRVMPTVDIAVYRDTSAGGREWLFVRKPNERLWRLPGGFVQASDASYQAAARRELREETGLSVEDLAYVWDGRIDDWRYRRESEQIMSILFAAAYTFGPVRPDDDVAEAQWFASLGDVHIVEEHEPMWRALRSWRG